MVKHIGEKEEVVEMGASLGTSMALEPRGVGPQGPKTAPIGSRIYTYPRMSVIPG